MQLGLDVNTWIAIAGFVATWLGIAYAFGRYRESVDNRLTSQGERIGKVEGSCAGNAADMETIKGRCQQLEFLVNSLTSGVGELRGSVKQLVETMERREEKERAEERGILDRLISIEKDIKHMDTDISWITAKLKP